MISPKKFVGLHSHSQFSLADAIGTPADHINFAIKNGMDSLALTDHGHMNGMSHQLLAAGKLNKEGKKFKAIPGVEAYFIPSLSEWSALKASVEEQKEKEKLAKKAKQLVVGDELSDTKDDLDDLVKSKVASEEEAGSVSENEEESKSKIKNPLFQRSHLVLLPKNSAGLSSLFRLVSQSYMNGFYRFPRMDFDMLRKEANGNLVASSACLAGYPGKLIFDFQKDPDWTKWVPNNDHFEEIQASLKDSVEKFKWALGEENYYLELQFNKLNPQHLLNYHLIEAAKRTNTKLIVTADAHYSDPAHWREREIYKAMAWMNKTKSEIDATKLPQTIDELKCELYPKNAEQIWDSYKKTSVGYDFYDDTTIKDAIERTWEIAHDQIGEISPNKTVKLPSLTKLLSRENLTDLRLNFPEVSEDDLAYKELLRVAKEKLVEKNKHQDQKYIDRLKLELGDIKHLGFSKYFLTYYKIIQLTQKELFIGNGRGSVSGSLLAYLLGISQVDPLRFGTLWSRFLTRHKKGMPDIDQDWSDRERAVELITEHFGEENVISVSNFSQLQVASLIKDLAKLFGVPFEEVNLYTGKMKNEAMAKAKQEPGFDAATWQFTIEVAEKDSPSFNEFMQKMEKYPEFKGALSVLFKQLRNVSRHAGGAVITSDASSHMPIIKAGGKLQTPWPEGLNFRHLEEFGFLKFDILGLGTLRMFESCIRKIIQKETGKKYVSFSEVREWFVTHLHPDNNDFSDMAVYKNVFWGNKHAGIFQFVKKNVQDFMAEMKPRSIEDIAVATSIFRPGPLGISADKLFLENRQNPVSIRYKHPLLEEVLRPTSGLIVFQEQLQQVYHKLANVPLDQTDNVRKAFTKKEIANSEEAELERLKMREEFADMCLQANSVPKKTSYEIFDEMKKFVKYSFNFSHAISYGITSWQCAYFLTYHPDEWITSYVDYSATEKGKVAGKEDPKVTALNEAKALGYVVKKPDINLSTGEFTIKGKELIPSFASLKYVGKAVVGEINDFRPYKTVEDLLWTKNQLHTAWRHSKFNKRALSTLIKMEAFDSMGVVGQDKVFKNYKQMHEVLVEKSDLLKKAISRKKNRNYEELLKQFIEEVQNIPDWTTDEKTQNQFMLSGSVDLGLICTPEIENFLVSNEIDPIERYESDLSNYWAIVQTSEVVTAKTGRKYLKLGLLGSDASLHKVNVWNYMGSKDEQEKLKKNSIIVATFRKDDYGMSTNMKKIYRIREDA